MSSLDTDVFPPREELFIRETIFAIISQLRNGYKKRSSLHTFIFKGMLFSQGAKGVVYATVRTSTVANDRAFDRVCSKLANVIGIINAVNDTMIKNKLIRENDLVIRHDNRNTLVPPKVFARPIIIPPLSLEDLKTKTWSRDNCDYNFDFSLVSLINNEESVKSVTEIVADVNDTGLAHDFKCGLRLLVCGDIMYIGPKSPHVELTFMFVRTAILVEHVVSKMRTELTGFNLRPYFHSVETVADVILSVNSLNKTPVDSSYSNSLVRNVDAFLTKIDEGTLVGTQDNFTEELSKLVKTVRSSNGTIEFDSMGERIECDYLYAIRYNVSTEDGDKSSVIHMGTTISPWLCKLGKVIKIGDTDIELWYSYDRIVPLRTVYLNIDGLLHETTDRTLKKLGCDSSVTPIVKL